MPAIEQATVSELIELDKNHVDRIFLRRRIMQEHPSVVLGTFPVSKVAVDELYTWLTRTYLPTRFPKVYQIRNDPLTRAGYLWDHAMEERVPLEPAVEPEETLRRLGGLIEDDLLFLLPADDGDGYQLKAFVTCFPNGFNTRKKLGMKLRDIHTPVPGYKEKLEKSMDRWFGRLQVGTFVRRYNVGSSESLRHLADTSQWTITPHDTLFTAAGNHLYEGEAAEEIDIDVNKVSLLS